MSNFPPNLILYLVTVELRVNDIVELVYVFSYYLNRRREFFYLRGESLVLARFEEGDVAGVLYGHRGSYGQLVCECPNLRQDSEWCDFLVV